MINNSSMFVTKYYEMDPEFEDLLFDGTLLRDGMVVLVESYTMKADLKDAEVDELQMSIARKFNRWCTVSELKKTATGMVEFIAIYGDAAKKKINISNSHSWIVKKDSIPSRGV